MRSLFSPHLNGRTDTELRADASHLQGSRVILPLTPQGRGRLAAASKAAMISTPARQKFCLFGPACLRSAASYASRDMSSLRSTAGSFINAANAFCLTVLVPDWN